MNVIERQAESFLKIYTSQIRSFFIEIAELDQELQKHLGAFKRIPDKVHLLSIIKQDSTEALRKHRETCKKNDCKWATTTEDVHFLVQQELEAIQDSSDKDDHDAFTTQQIYEINNKLENFKSALIKNDLGNEIIFDELDELKQDFRLGKKKWTQIFQAKLIDLLTKNLLTETVVKPLWDEVMVIFRDAVKFLGM